MEDFSNAEVEGKFFPFFVNFFFFKWWFKNKI